MASADETAFVAFGTLIVKQKGHLFTLLHDETAPIHAHRCILNLTFPTIL